jgi:hypothetical protein
MGAGNLFFFKVLAELFPAGYLVRGEEIAAGSNRSLSMIVTGNNSVAFLLTLFR